VLQQVHVAERTEPVIHADHDDIAAAGQALAVVYPQLVARAGRVPAAVNPDQDRPLARVARRWRPHVDAEAVLAWLAVIPLEHERFLVMRPAGAASLRHVKGLR